MKRSSKLPFTCQRDGLTIRGHVFGDTSPGKPVVIISHGFLATEKTVYDYARVLAEDGFLAVTFDFNGGGIGSRSDGKSENMTLLTEKEDLLAVIHRHLKGTWDFSSWNKWLSDADELLQNDSFIRSFENNIGLEDGFCGFDYWETISKCTKLYQALVEIS